MNEIKNQSVKTKTFLKSILNTLPGNVVILNSDLCIFMVNDNWVAFGENNGLEKSVDWIGKNYLDFYNELSGIQNEGATVVFEGIQKIKKGELNKFEIEFPCHSIQEKRWFKMYASAIDFENKKWITVTYLDISAVKIEQAQLLVDQRNLYASEKLGLIGHWEWDLITEQVVWSKEMYQIYEMDVHENLSFKLIDEKIHPEDRSHRKKCIATLLENADSIAYEYRVLGENGRTKHINLVGRIERNEFNVPVKIFGTSQDITQTKLTQNKKKEAEQNYYGLLEQANDGITLIKNGLISYSNNALSELLGYTKEEFEHESFLKFIVDEEEARVTNYYNNRVNGKKAPTVYQSILEHKNGGFIDVELNVDLAVHEGETATLAIIRDIRERKKEERIKENLLVDLNNKTNKLQCLQDISKKLVRFSKVEDILQEVTSIISGKLKFDKTVDCKILFDGEIYKSTSFEEGSWKLKNTLKIDQIKRGYIEVYYPDAFNETNTKEILAEEKDLLNQIANTLSSKFERREVQIALQQNEIKYRDLVDNSILGVFRTTISGEFIFANEALVEMYEFSSLEDMIAKGSISRWSDIKDRERMLHELQENGVVKNFKVDTITDKGNLISIVFSARRHGNNITGMVMNMTDQVKYEQLIINQKELLENTIESLSHPFYVIDAKSFKVNLANSAAKKRGIIVGGPTCFNAKYGISHPCTAKSHNCPLNEVIEKRTSTIVEHAYIDKNGIEHLEEVHGHPIFDKEGKVSQMIEYTLDISARKKAEKELKESEAKFKTLVVNNDEIIYLIDNNGQILLSEGKGLEKVGLIPGKLVGENMFELYHEYPEILNSMQIAMKGVSNTSDLVFEGQYFKSTHSPYRNEKGDIIGIVGFIINFTKRYEAEKALIESEQKFKTLVTTNKEIVYMVDKDGIFLLSEGDGLEKIGLKSGQVVGMNVHELYKDFPSIIDDIDACLLGETITSEVEMGKEYFRSWYSPHYNEHGDIIGAIGLVINLTDQKFAEKALKVAGTRLKLATSAARIGHWDWDLEKDIAYLSKEWKEQLGYQNNEIESDSATWKSLMHPDDMEMVLTAVDDYIQGKTDEYVVEFRLKHKDGSYKWVYSRAEKMLNADGVGNRLFGCHVDITDRKNAELTILNHKERLKDLAMELTLTEEKQRKQIATDLHDDVGQLLASSRLQLAAINASTEMDQVLHKTKNISKGMLNAIRAIRAAIFDLSSPQLNEIGLFAATSDWMEEQLEEKYGILTTIEGDESLRIKNDNLRVLIFRSIRELLFNVVKHANTKKVKVIFEKSDTDIKISIEDFGIGFNYHPELLRLKNTGFGLFSVQERMLNIGGTMEIKSIINKGTKIILKLPIES